MKIPGLDQIIDPAVFDRLTARERRILGGAAAALAGLSLFLIVQATYGRLARLEARETAARARLTRITELVGEYRALESEYEGLMKVARSGDALAQIVEGHARRAKVEEYITSLKNRAAPPGDADFEMTGVEIQIADAPLAGLVELMASLERDRRALLQFGRVRIEGQGEIGQRKMDANLQVLRFVSRG